ncbi:MAG: ABC transporter ATP-binding protein [Chloroflexi bacterium]|nr:ABC transporter ATP-binding protein [Chloroflexota bacterium]
MIEVHNLTKFYGPKQALDGVTFHVGKGEILGLLGPNGAGKSTTMKILTGYLPPSGGSATVAGYDVSRQSLDARRCVGYLPETVPLYTDLPVRAYLDFMAKLKGVPRRARRDEIDRVMEMVSVDHVADTLIAKLSKGYRQRVGLAQALLGNPPVLVLDEPTIGLDPAQIIETRKMIKGLAGEHSVILSTHILPEVGMTCDRVVIINRGRVVAEDTPENLNRRLRGAELIHVEARGPEEGIAEALSHIPHVVRLETASAANGRATFLVESALGSDVREQIAAALVHGGFGLLELRPANLSLEEIFLQLTTTEEVAA